MALSNCVCYCGGLRSSEIRRTEEDEHFRVDFVVPASHTVLVTLSNFHICTCKVVGRVLGGGHTTNVCVM